MEDKKEIPCLRLEADEIGLLREAPARRWLTGQEEWDKRFGNVAKNVEKRRRKAIEKYDKTLARARELGLVHSPGLENASVPADDTTVENEGDGEIQKGRRWGPLDLESEHPPPSAIAGRRDTVSLLFSFVIFLILLKHGFFSPSHWLF